jgi:hypothetical protein
VAAPALGRAEGGVSPVRLCRADDLVRLVLPGALAEGRRRVVEHPSVGGRYRDGRGGRPADEFFGGATARQKVRKKAFHMIRRRAKDAVSSIYRIGPLGPAM